MGSAARHLLDVSARSEAAKHMRPTVRAGRRNAQSTNGSLFLAAAVGAAAGSMAKQSLRSVDGQSCVRMVWNILAQEERQYWRAVRASGEVKAAAATAHVGNGDGTWHSGKATQGNARRGQGNAAPTTVLGAAMLYATVCRVC